MAKIMIVDDDKSIAEVLQQMFRFKGYETVATNEPRDALALAKKEKPDLVVLDVSMPGMSGFEVCRLLRGEAQTAAIRIVMLTARKTDYDTTKGLNLGADAYLTKPFEPGELLVRVSLLLGVSAAED